MQCGGDNSVALVNKHTAVDRIIHKGEVNAVTQKNGLVVSGGDDEKVVVSKIVGA